MEYIEIVTHHKYNRGKIIHISELPSYYGADYQCYNSVYLYDKEIIEYIQETGSLRSYQGQRYINELVLDIDKGDNSPEYTLEKTKSIVQELLDTPLDEQSMQVYFSGTGFHIHLSAQLFNFTIDQNLPATVKSTIQSMFNGDVDTSIFNRSGIIRTINTLNTKSLLFKIPLTLKELFHLKIQDIRSLATKPRFDIQLRPLTGNGELADKIVITKIQNITPTFDPNNVAICIQRLYDEGPQNGTRNATILRLASHFRRNGLPYRATLSALQEWNLVNGIPSLDKAEVEKRVASVYKAGYTYSCNDKLLASKCSAQCVFYRKKDMNMRFLNVEELQEQLETRVKTNFEGRILNLGVFFGKETGLEIYPGELVTIFGPTGMNKTTLAQSIALGYSAVTGDIQPTYQLSTIYFCLELQPWLIHARNLQIVAGVDQETVKTEYESLFRAHEHKLSHIIVQPVSPTIDHIKEALHYFRPKVIIIDYIELIDHPGSDYEKLTRIMQALRNLATNEDIIIIAISQISREYAKPVFIPEQGKKVAKPLDLHAGKGTGAIENSSSKVIGIWGDNRSGDIQTRYIQLFKNTNGDLYGPVKLTIDIKTLRMQIDSFNQEN